MILRKIILSMATALAALGAIAQVENAGGVRKRSERDKNKTESGPKITGRMQGFFEDKEPHDADLSYMREIYRQLDLTKPANTPLYYPEDVIDGKENLFRIILKLVVDGKIPAYEYLDGREIFTDQYKMNVADMLERFGIYAQEAKGSTEKNPKFVIEEADVPTGQVLNYYIIEKWEFDRRTNRMKTRVEAICPVLNRAGDFGGETKYPMFWVKFDDLRPYMSTQNIFLTDDNNLPTSTYDDFFLLGMYDGDIIKTRNLRNQSMMQLYPDSESLKRAQDSIQHQLDNFDKKLWVPSLEELEAQREAREKAEALAEGKAIEAEGDSIAADKPKVSRRSSVKRGAKKEKAAKVKTKKAKAPKAKAASTATRSVRNRKR